MEVVARMHRPLATLREEGAEVGLVGRLIQTESGVAIDTVGAILDGEPGDILVIGTDSPYQLLAKGIPALHHRLIASLIGRKPFAIVMRIQVAQKV